VVRWGGCVPDTVTRLHGFRVTAASLKIERRSNVKDRRQHALLARKPAAALAAVTALPVVARCLSPRQRLDTRGIGTAHIPAARFAASFFSARGDGSLVATDVLDYANAVVGAIAQRHAGAGAPVDGPTALEMQDLELLVSTDFRDELDVMPLAEALACAYAERLPVPPWCAQSSAPALLLAELGDSHEAQVVRLAAQLAAPLLDGWPAAFEVRFLRFCVEINAGLNSLSRQARELPPAERLLAVLRATRATMPHLLLDDADLVADMLERRGLPRPALVLVPPNVDALSACPACARGVLKLRPPTEKGTLLTNNSRIECGVCAYTAHCPKCEITYGVSYSQRAQHERGDVDGASVPKERTYYAGACGEGEGGALVLHVSERLFVYNSVLRNVNKKVYYGARSVAFASRRSASCARCRATRSGRARSRRRRGLLSAIRRRGTRHRRWSNASSDDDDGPIDDDASRNRV
jgi:hypothetical protein